MKNIKGFTLIELIIFIVVTGILASTILLSAVTALRKIPTTHQNLGALQSARQCLEWLLGQRRLNGYNFISCPSSTLPSFCTVPSGYTASINVTCTTLSGDASYKTLTVTLSGQGHATLTLLIANY